MSKKPSAEVREYIVTYKSEVAHLPNYFRSVKAEVSTSGERIFVTGGRGLLDRIRSDFRKSGVEFGETTL